MDINEKLRSFINSVFEDAPNNTKTVELKEEILINLTDRYNDLISEGKSEEAAYNIAVASVGDISDLVRGLKSSDTRSREQSTISKSYIEKGRQRYALIIAVSVCMYILCLIPVIVTHGAIQSVVAMFIMIAAATGLIIYASITKPKYIRSDDSIVEEFKQWQHDTESQKRVYHAIKSSLWLITVTLYFVISFATMAWHISWIIFLIAAIAENIIKAIYDITTKR